MDVTFSNVLEGTRQYFMGLPKQAQGEGTGQHVWPTGAPPPEEGAPALSGAPTPSSRPPSAAAAPPSAPIAVPPRPISEPLEEPEPHIIHKATVMREAAEKRREQPEPDDEEEAPRALSPPSHIIRKPLPRTLPSPAPAPAAPCPSPARPPSTAPMPPVPVTEQALDSSQYRPPAHRVQTPIARPPDPFAPSRLPDPYSATRPPESYPRYSYETSVADVSRNVTGPPVPSPQPSVPPRQSPQTYARLSSTMPTHTSRLREAATQSPPAQRYVMPPVQPLPLNDRVPPIHHPQAPLPQRISAADSRTTQYSSLVSRREPSPFSRPTTHYDRHPTLPQRKYDPQQAYPGYRPAPAAPLPITNQRVDSHQHHQVQYKHAVVDPVSAHYAARSQDRVPPPQHYQHDPSRHTHEVPRRTEYPTASRTVDARSGYPYPAPSTSSARYPSTAAATVPIVNSSGMPSRATVHRPATGTAPKSNYEYPSTNHVQTSPARSTVKPGYPNQQARMTVSVTTLVNQMNQTKHKRESPLDLSVKTVKNSADSSTTQDDVVDSATIEAKTLPLQPRPTSSSSSRSNPSAPSYVESHKVDFSPDFTRFRERSASQNYSTPAQPVHHPVRYNGSYETTRSVAEPYPVESRHHVFADRSKYNIPVDRVKAYGDEYVPRIDLTRTVNEERRPDHRMRDDRNMIIEDRKRHAGPIVSNIPDKIVRYETWSADSRIDRMAQSAREQHELMSRPVYSYSSHKQFEAYQNEQKRAAASTVYRDHTHLNHRYSYPELPTRDYQAHYHDRNPSSSSRPVIQKTPSHRDFHHHNSEPHSGIPADKRVLSILRNSLETKQTGLVEPARSAKKIPDLIVIDDVDDSVIEITDLTKDNDTEISAKTVTHNNSVAPILSHHIHMPKAVDSINRDLESQKSESADSKSKSPESDVASRIRTKAELKVLPPSQDSSIRADSQQEKPLPKSQKQHLFNQIREDNLRLESVIKNDKPSEIILSEVKSEPMNIDEIEKDAVIPLKTENTTVQNFATQNGELSEGTIEDDWDWANACDSFVEQLKTGIHKKKSQRKRNDTLDQDTEKAKKVTKLEPKESNSEELTSPPNIEEKTPVEIPSIIIKQEPIDDEEVQAQEQTDFAQKAIETIEPTIDKNVENIKAETSIQESEDEDKPLIERLSTSQDKKEKYECKENKSLPEREPTKEEEESIIKSLPTLDEHQKDQMKNKKSTENGKEKDKWKTKKRETSEVIKKVKNETKIEKPGSIKKDKNKVLNKSTKNKSFKKEDKIISKTTKDKTPVKTKLKTEKTDSLLSSPQNVLKASIKTIIKEESESTDDDEPLINSKLQKEKNIKFQLMKDLTEKSAYVKLECFDVDMNKNTRISLDSLTKEKDSKLSKGKTLRQISKPKEKSVSIENIKIEQHNESTSDSDDDVAVASRLRVRKNTKTDECKATSTNKASAKSSPLKKQDNSSSSSSSTPIRKPGFGDGSDFHPGWEAELYRFKRSLRMPPRLIAIPRGQSGGPFVKGSGALFTRGSTSLPDLDPAPLSPAPSSAPSAATDDLYARRQDKLTLDSDLESNSSSSAVNRLHYDSEASTSTVFSSTKAKKKTSSIVDVLIQKCGRKDDSRKKLKEKDEKTPKIIPKSSSELLPTPSLSLVKNGNKGSLNIKKEKLLEDIFYLGAFRKETVTAFRDDFIKNTDGLIGATQEFAPVVLKSRTRTESRVLKQRATIKEVFGDERPASAPPTSCRETDEPQIIHEEPAKVEIKKETELIKPKLKPKKIIKDKFKRRSSSIRDGLRSTALKRSDAKGRLLRFKKRNNMIKSINNKRMRDMTVKVKKEKTDDNIDDKVKSKEEGSSLGATEVSTKRRLKRLFGRRKFSSGFDYIRKKKKTIRSEGTPSNRIRRPTVKPSPESVHDILKEIKSWFINKSVGETHLHRAARLGYTDCVAYCLEKLDGDPSAKDNAGFTPLHVAAAKGHVRISRLLLQYGSNVSAAAQGGIRPLHEACENGHVEIIRLLLAYGADPVLGTYAGQTPEELAEGPAARLLRLHLADVQGQAVEPWRFPPLGHLIDREELGCDPLSSPPPASPPPPPDSMVEIQCTEAPLPPFYSLRTAPGQPADGLWCLLQDVTNLLQIKSKDSLLKQIHCGSGSPKELLREIRTQEFLERAQCNQLLGAGEKVNVRASKVALVRVTDKLRQLLKIETVLVS